MFEAGRGMSDRSLMEPVSTRDYKFNVTNEDMLDWRMRGPYNRCMHKAVSIFCVASVIVCSRGTDLKTIAFDELSQQPANGLNVKGVTFRYEGVDPVLPAPLFGVMMAGETKIMNAPYLQAGTSGSLTLEFPRPTEFLSFSIGLAGGGPQTPGYMVGLFSGGIAIGSTPVNTQMGGTGPFSFSEGTFTYSDPTRPLSAVTVTIAPPRVADIFVLDNVTFIPEPGAVALGGLGAAAIVARMWRRKYRTLVP